MPMHADQLHPTLEPSQRIELIDRALNSTMFSDFEFNGWRVRVAYVSPGDRSLQTIDIKRGDTSYFRMDPQGNICKSEATRCVRESFGDNIWYYRNLPVDPPPTTVCDNILLMLSAENCVPPSVVPLPTKAAVS